jgi:very-short-patch-repair endonuclease/predicted RNA-binding Zn-ribbon protein involved in translation (DUF1610 family)
MEKLPTILVPSIILESRRQGQDHLQQTLSQTLPPIGLRYKTPKGHAETQFERDLWHYFPGKIHTGLTVQHPDYEQPYIPDFVYIDPHLNLHIDIEIDEPYAYVSREPLHYLGCAKDATRNQFFLDSGWLVIRFSEAQVVKQSASCCKAIAATIATLTNDNTAMHPFRQVPTLKPELRWTQAEAQQMAENAIREQYSQPYALEQSVKRKRKKPQTIRKVSIVSANFTFYCPECGDGPIRWQGHYVQCPNCSYDAFAL